MERETLISNQGQCGTLTSFRLIYELLWVFESVAAGTEGFRLSRSNYPGVGLVAVKTLHALFHMETVLTHPRFVGVALSQTVR